MKVNWRLEAGLLLIGAGLLLVFQWNALITGRTTLAHDHVYWGLPLYGFFVESLGQGRLPLWNPFTHGGEPAYLALFQLRLLDPSAISVALVGPWFTSDLLTLYVWDRVVRGIVVAGGIYLLLRPCARHLVTRVSLVAILFLSSVQWSHARQMAVAEQFLLAPLVILMFLRVVYLGDSRWRNWIAGALLFGMSFQTYFFTGTAILLCALSAGFLLFQRRLITAACSKRAVVPRTLVAAAILAVMLAPSVVLLGEADRFVFPPRVIDYDYEGRAPNQGPSQFEPRGEVKWSRPLLYPYALQAHVGSFAAPDDYIQMLAPFANEYARPAGRPWGKPSEAFVYIGLLPLALALLGAVAGRHPLRRIGLFVLVVMGLLALGPPAFVHAALYWVFPPLWLARNTHALVLFLVLPLLYFLVLGCERVASAGRRGVFRASRPEGPIGRRYGASTVARLTATGLFGLTVCAAVMILSRLRFPFTFYMLPVMLTAGTVGWVLRRDLGQAGLYWGVLGGWVTGVSLLALRAQDRTSLLFLAVFLLVPLLVWGYASAQTRRAREACLILSALLAGGVVLHRAYALTGSLRGVEALGLTPGYVLAGIGTVLMVTAVTTVVVKRVVNDQRLLSRKGALGVAVAALCFDLLGYSGYVRGLAGWTRPDDFLPLVTRSRAPGFPATREAAPPVPPGPAYEQTIRYLDVAMRRAAAFSPLFVGSEAGALDRTAGSEVARLQEGPRASTFLMTRSYQRLLAAALPPDVLAEVFAIERPLIRLRSSWVWLDERDVPRLLNRRAKTGEIDGVFRETVVLAPVGDSASSRPDGARGGMADARARWTVRHYDYNALDLEVETPARVVLYWADGFDPSWRAWIDGTEVVVHRANLAFKAVFVPPGLHAIRFEYRPVAIVVTALLFVALGFGGAIVGVWALASPRRLPRFGGRA